MHLRTPVRTFVLDKMICEQAFYVKTAIASGCILKKWQTCQMGKTKSEIRAELVSAFETEVDRLLAWEDESEQVTITDIEEQVLVARRRISERLTEMLAQQRAQKADLSVPTAAGSGQHLHYKGKKTRPAKRAREW